LVLVSALLAKIRDDVASLSAGDPELAWALRRKVYKELVYDERGKPMHRKALKSKLRILQDGCCASCGQELPERGAVADRLEAMMGYTEANVRLLCPSCDVSIQSGRGYA
jgi:ribosomal protein L44E